MRGIIEVNLKNLTDNFCFFREKLPQSVSVAAVVKANAYGHGLKEVVRALSEKADYFIVATFEEALLAREHTEKRILCLSPLRGEEIVVSVFKNIDIIISSERDLDEIICKTENMRIPTCVHMCVDTGMNRMGIKSEKAAYKLINRIKSHKNIKLEGVFSHFFDAENKQRREMQTKRFNGFLRFIDCALEDGENRSDKQTDKTADGCGGAYLAHIAATEAALCCNSLYSMVRIGIGLYGYGVSGVKPCMSVKSLVSRVEKVKKGEYVGYNGAFIATKDCFVATVSAGYGDGICRSFSGGEVLINGRRRKIIGNVCMDYCFALTDKETKAGDEVVFIGEQGGDILTAEDMAKACGTISYEILTSFKRFPVKYIRP